MSEQDREIEAQKREDVLMDMYKLHAYIPNDAEGNPLTPFGNFCAGYEAATAEANKRIDALESEIAELKNWKKEVIAVENEWDEQLIGKALNIQLGNSIRANILPKINELQANNNRLREALLSSIRYVPEYSKSLDAIQQALSKTPAQSLQSVINETIEECAKIADAWENISCKYKIRALKQEVK